MSELDDKIREALRAEDADILEALDDEPSVLERVMETFRGRNRWLTFYVMFWGTAFFAASIFAAVKFFKAQDTRDQIMWAAVAIICWTTVYAIKVWYWLDMNKNSVTREIKRVELQIARLAARMKQ